MTASLEHIRKAQLAWARSAGRESSRPEYVATLEDNLFQGLKGSTKSEFLEGDGAELDDTGTRPAKMRSCLSSSALAVNFFDAWRGVRLDDLGEALRLSARAAGLSFEYKPKRYPVGPRSPNLDLLVSLVGGARVAVESKFTEPFRSTGDHGLLSPRYFPAGRAFWAGAGLARAQNLAERLSVEWQYLDPSQLLKHMLGIACEDDGPATLLYLWYDTGLIDARTHRTEVARFAELVEGDRVGFRAMSYQELFAAIPHNREPVDGWHDSMSARYSAPVAHG